MTLLVGSLFAESIEQTADAARRAFAGGADAVELRIDSFEGDPSAIAALVRSEPGRTWIITCRSAEEGGQFRGDTMERVSRLLVAARGTNAYVDFEFADWRRSANIRQKVLLAAASADGGNRLILSHHDWNGKPANVDRLAADMLSIQEAGAAKIAYRGRSAGDSFAALDLMKAHGSRIIAIDMGESGVWTRVLAGKLGAFATYASLGDDAPTAPGQLSIEAMRGRCGWAGISKSTRVFGLIGDPLSHSMSPALHNHWFTQTNTDAVYVPIRVGRGESEVGDFLNALCDRDFLEVGGLSVTVPHKEYVAKWLGDRTDRLAGRIGAVNTLVWNGRDVRGFNTDCYAAKNSLVAVLGGAGTEWAGMTVDVLGAGGSAKAIVAGLIELGCRVCVFARRRESAVMADSGVVIRDWEERAHGTGSVVVNCTPLGMHPHMDESPMPAEALCGRRCVFDLIYNPRETRLLREARSAGCLTLGGSDMFLRQAATQFELWTGRSPDMATGRTLLEAELNTPASPLGKGGSIGVASRGPDSKSCIVLIGLRGSGKTTVGRELARLLGVVCLDTDEEVERRAGKSIAEIFSTEGEAGFRRRESEVIADVAQSPPRVMSLGGGALLDDRNVERLRPVATLVWLTASAEELWERISRDSTTAARRPALTDQSGVAELRELQFRREAIYRRVAELVVETTGRTSQDIAYQVAHWFPSRG